MLSFLCAERHYVTARPRRSQSRGHTQLCRHIIFRFRKTVTVQPNQARNGTVLTEGHNALSIPAEHGSDTLDICKICPNIFVTALARGQDAVPPAFVEAVIDDGPDQDGQDARPAMVIELSGGIKVVISASAPPSLAAAALRALR